MSVRDRIETLQTKHAALERELDEEAHRPLPNIETLTRIKREKLRLKDEMSRLSAQPAAVGA